VPCSPQSAESVVGWISRHLPEGPKPAIQRPLNYFRIVTITTTLLGILTFISVAYPYVLPVVQNRNLWAGVSLITILLFTSGHMFNHIRKVPYVTGDGKGGISYFAGGFSNQFGMETQIVAAMCKRCQPELAPAAIPRLTLISRWHTLLRNHCPCSQSSSNVRS
jgi:oligosaccharyltransferase complex subunit gamma